MLLKDEKSAVAQMEASTKAGDVKSWSSLASKVKSKAAANDRKRTATKVPVPEGDERFNANKKFRR